MYYNKTMLPPILQFSYPGFRFQGDAGQGLEVSIPASLSLTNTLKEIDHIQIRLVSLSTNLDGLNKNIFPYGIYFIKFKEDLMSIEGSDRAFNVMLKTVIDGVNIFSVGGEPPYPTRYKIQIRVKEKGSSNYQEAYGQNPPREVFHDMRAELSEWSNSSIIKTVSKPDVGIFNLNPTSKTTLLESDYTFQGWYKSDDDLESLSSYQFNLYSGGQLIEEGKKIFIGVYEGPNINYKFKEIFVSNTEYTIELKLETSSDYIHIERYVVDFDLSFTRLYNIFNISSEDEGAYNSLEMEAHQIQLIASEGVDELSWLEDSSFDLFGEIGASHYKLTNGTVRTPEAFGVPYDTFSVIFSVTGLMSKVQTRINDCFTGTNHLLSFGSGGGLGTQYKLGVIKRAEIPYRFVLEEKDSKLDGTTVNHYIVDFVSPISNNSEFIFIIKKDRGDTLFEVHNWITNEFVTK